MEEKIKEFLETQFKTIPPTVAAMNYRKQILVEMLDRAQELRIKGINDNDLIFNMIIEEYGNFQDTLQKFAQKQIKNDVVKRSSMMGMVVAFAIVSLLAITYVIVGACFKIWHPTWLIIVGGVFIAAVILLSTIASKLYKKGRYLMFRCAIAVCEILLSVFIFLILQLVVNAFNGSWMTFLVMVVLILGVDTIVAFYTENKLKWIELPVFIEIFFVMLYIILGITINGFWHPGWVICLIGVLFVIIEVSVFIVVKGLSKNKEELSNINAEFVEEDKSYWTKWD